MNRRQAPGAADEPIFVMGVSRSGNSLMAGILDDHPGISVYDETHFLRKVWSAQGQRTLGREDLANALKRVLNLEKEGLRPEEIESDFMRTDRTTRSLYETILTQRMKARNKRRYGENTPSNFWFLDLLANWYPRARFLFLIRDPRDVHSSFKHHTWVATTSYLHRNVLRRALYWSYAAQVLKKSKRRYPDQVMKVSFERLIGDTDSTVHAVFDFVGEDPLERAGTGAAYGSFAEIRRSEAIRSETSNRREGLSRLETAGIEVICGSDMLLHGYRPSLIPVFLIRLLRAVGCYGALQFVYVTLRRFGAHDQ